MAGKHPGPGIQPGVLLLQAGSAVQAPVGPEEEGGRVGTAFQAEMESLRKRSSG